MSISISVTLTSSSDEDPPRARRPRVLRDRSDPFEKYDEIDFKQRFRFSKASVMEILHLIGENLTPMTHRNKSLSAREQFLLCLRFYATGAYQQLIGDSVLLNKSTVCRVVYKVSRRLASLKQEAIKMPSQDQMAQVHGEFYRIRGFPRVIGAIDGTHIPIRSPGGANAETFRCRKGFFSINVQAVCDANLKIRHIIARWPGSVHDSTIFNDCPLPAELEMGMYGEGYLLGDSGYACKRHLLTPLLNPRNPAEEAYNTAHKATRNTIERSFGVWKRRFPCLSLGLRLKMETNLMVIVSCAVLHNLALSMNDEWPEDDADYDDPEEEIAVDNLQGNFAMRTALINTIFAHGN